MPIYEYECRKCGKLTTVLQKISDKAPTDCEFCGGKGSLVKRVSHSSFVLKGGGWFKDCYPDAKSTGTSAYKDETTKNKDTAACCSCPASGDCPHQNS